jgi:hypothetical protein
VLLRLAAWHSSRQYAGERRSWRPGLFQGMCIAAIRICRRALLRLRCSRSTFRLIPIREQMWSSLKLSDCFRIATDDQGHFRITGVAPGEYLLQIALTLNETFVSTAIGEAQGSSSSTMYSLNFYSGDTAEQSKGKSFRVGVGEQRDGSDLNIPVGKLHRVTGTIIEGQSGHVVNAGNAWLNFEDGTKLASTIVDANDSEFHFEFGPEGTYTLLVSDAKDVLREEIPQPAGWFPPSTTKETMVREYGTQQQSLKIESDVTGVVVSVAPKGAKPAGPQ